MPSLSFSAPTSVDEAVKILAGSSGMAKVLAGGTDLAGAAAVGSDAARHDRRHQTDPGADRHPRGGEPIRHRRLDPGDHAVRKRGADPCLAGDRRGHRPDRLGADPGPRLARRQSVQRVAGGRQRAGDDRRARDLRDRRAQRQTRSRRSRRSSPAPAAPRCRRASSSSSSTCRNQSRISPTPICALSRAPRWTSRSSAAASTSRSTASGVCTDARVVLGAVAPTQIVCDEAAKALIGHRLDEPTLAALDAAAGRACNPITDKRGTIEYRIKVAGVLARRAATIAFERAGAR